MMEEADETKQPSSEARRVVLPEPLSASDLIFSNAPEKDLYWDRSHYESVEAQKRALSKSSTLYVGNLAFSTRSQHVMALFSMVGPVVKVHMGLDRFKKTPCGFCFVEYKERRHALEAVASLSACMLDGRAIRAELDAGFFPGRQYGRGASGGQVRDERRKTADPARAAGGGGRRGGDSNYYGRQQPRPYPGDRRPRDQQSGDQPYSYYGRQEPRPGEKRGRDEGDDNEVERPSKNPRFREDDDN